MDDRRKQILATLAQMDKQFGKGSVLMLGSRAALPVAADPGVVRAASCRRFFTQRRCRTRMPFIVSFRP